MQKNDSIIGKMNCAAAVGFMALILGWTAVTPLAQANDSNPTPANPHAQPAPAAPGVPPESLGVSFVDGSTTTMIVERGGKKYLVDLVARTVTEAGLAAEPALVGDHNPESSPAFVGGQATGAILFKSNCSKCHGMDGKGMAGLKTPNFTDPKLQASLTDAQIIDTINHGKKGTMMPAWQGKLSVDEIKLVAAHIRSFGESTSANQSGGAQSNQENSKVYTPGDDYLFSLPTGRRLDRHGFYVNFNHRFAFGPAFSGKALGHTLGGLDNFSLSSLGIRYGVTKDFSVSLYRSPSTIGRPIQMMAAYNFVDEHDGRPLNGSVRFSVDGENDFSKNFTANIEGIFSRSLGHSAQLYAVPTLSFQNRRLIPPQNNLADPVPDLPGFNTFSVGFGGAFDIRPTVAIVAEVIPTFVGGREMDIHRPAYSIGIQKRLWRHAFTFGFTTGPGTTVNQRAGTRASYLDDPGADKPSGLFIGFDLTRQIY